MNILYRLILGSVFSCLSILGIASESVSEDHRPSDLQKKETGTQALSIQEWSTRENIAVFLVERHELPIVDVQLIFPAGSAQDRAAHGLAYLSAYLIGQGTDRNTSQEIARTFANMGTIINRSVERDHVTFSLRSVSDFEPLNTSFQLFSEIIGRVNIKPSDFNRQKSNQLIEVQSYEDLPHYIASKALFAQLYEDDPYAHPRLGTPTTVFNLRLSEVMDFYQQYYTTNHAILIFVGDIDESTARQFSKKLSQNLRRAPQKEQAREPDPVVKKIGQRIKKTFDTSQTQILKGLLIIKYRDPDQVALTVLNEILGGSSESLLMKTIRDQQGLAYSAYSQMIPYQRTGPWIMLAQTRNEQAAKMEESMDTLLKRLLQEGPTLEEFEAAKQRLLGQFALQLASNAEISNIVAWLALGKYPLDYLDQYRNQLEALTLEQLNQVIHTRLSWEAVQTIVVAP